ncbi:MAG: M48 family metallopeptidase [Proteobacteria bacterium]|nr:M48 family metallopeptidase [Pseudomonadota bacterium]
MFFKKKKPQTSAREAGGMDYTLVRSSRRTLSLQIREGGELVVRAPHRTPLREIEDWIFKKRKWIERHQNRFEKIAIKAPVYRDGAGHFYLGVKYPLRIVKGVRHRAELRDGVIILTLRGAPGPEKIERALKAWYLEEAWGVFEDRLSKLFPPFAGRNHDRPEIKIRWMKSRWGSMGREGVMTLNAKLMLKETGLIDYVIVHELCHMEHMNHGPKFYALMDQMLPGWKGRRKMLKGDL